MKSHDFRISPLSIDAFRPLFTLSDQELAARGARRYIADKKPGFPCRVSLEDAEIGESVILVPYVHHEVDGPYRSSGPIFIREQAKQANLGINEMASVIRNRLLSIRAYDSDGTLVASEVTEGSAFKEKVAYFFADNTVAYLHVHNAKPGCYSCRVDRANP